MVGVKRGGGGREEWRGTGERGKETLVSDLILEVNWEEATLQGPPSWFTI